MGASFAKDQSINFTEEEIKKLYQKFKELDADENGTLEPNEFFDVPELSQNPIVQRVIDVFDKNKDGKISFTEFISGLSSLHAEGPIEEKIRFVFNIYDMDGDGFISNGELFKVLKMMVGSNLKDSELQQLVDRTIVQADKDFDGMISFKEFCDAIENINVGESLKLELEES